jgi:hypothetical protein
MSGLAIKLLKILAASLDLLLLFSYSTRYAYSVLPQILRGLLQEVRPRCVSRNRPIPCQLHIRGVFAVRREKALPTLRSDSRQAAFYGPEKGSP